MIGGIVGGFMTLAVFACAGIIRGAATEGGHPVRTFFALLVALPITAVFVLLYLAMLIG
jgi:hypothetical protein